MTPHFVRSMKTVLAILGPSQSYIVTRCLWNEGDSLHPVLVFAGGRPFLSRVPVDALIILPGYQCLLGDFPAPLLSSGTFVSSLGQEGYTDSSYILFYLLFLRPSPPAFSLKRDVLRELLFSVSHLFPDAVSLWWLHG